MSLIAERESVCFDAAAIQKQDVIWAKHTLWPSAKTGVVTSVTADEVAVLYVPPVGNASNYFVISAAEVAAGSCTLRWSRDLQTVYSHVPAGGGVVIE